MLYLNCALCMCYIQDGGCYSQDELVIGEGGLLGVDKMEYVVWHEQICITCI